MGFDGCRDRGPLVDVRRLTEDAPDNTDATDTSHERETEDEQTRWIEF